MEISVGRLRYPRSSIFLNHWLVARTEVLGVRTNIPFLLRYLSHSEVRAGRVTTGLLHGVLKYAVRGGRTADIAQADKKHTHFRH